MNDFMDISSISLEDLQDEYQKLKEKWAQLVALSEQDRQRIHELKRSLDTATAAEAYLSQELEQLSSVQTSHDDALLHKKQNEIDELKKRQSILITENEELHEDVAALTAENERLKLEIKELNSSARPVEISYQIPKEFMELRDKLEAENLELLAKLDETHESIVKFTMALAEKEKHIEIFKDQVHCLEENLQSKREEVDEKSHLLESAQEQVVEMNAKIALLTSCPDNADRKGNSLFAEVDDQRQAMKQLLAAQKKSYLQMKKIFNESQHEIRRLKRENVAMHTELQTCSSIFCSADKVYKEKLNERILQLIKQNEDLEKKLIFTQQELLTLANDKGVVWLDSMLLFCKQETEDMRQELHSMRIQKGILEEKLRNCQQELAKWRFEALKLRCTLIDRETLLTDNNIQFKAFTNRDVAFSENELKNAKPNVKFTNDDRNDKQHQENEVIELDTSVLNQHEESVILLEDCKPPLQVKDEIVATIKVEEAQEQEPELPQTQMKSLSIEIFKDETLDFKVKTELESPNPNYIANLSSPALAQTQLESHNPIIKTEPTEDIDNKENIFLRDNEEETIPNNCAKIPLNIKSLSHVNSTNQPSEHSPKPRPSILVTKKDIFADEGQMKSVHFSNSVEKSEKSNSTETKAAAKPKRNKSSLVVRRILVGSKSKSSAPSAPTIRH